MYVLTCDVEACGAEIQRGPGQPSLHRAERIHCPRCAEYVAQVEAQLRVEMARLTHEGIDWLNTRRAELMAKMLPAERGGDGTGFSRWPTVG